MKKYVPVIILLFITTYAKPQNYIHIVADSLGVSKDAMSTAAMTDRLKEDAEKFAQYAPLPRIAEMDMAFGADLEEYKKLCGYGILYIPSLNQDISEYPIVRVYIKQGNIITELKKIGEVNVGVHEKSILNTFGKNRVDYYYLIPYTLTQVYGELMIDWTTNRKEFVLTKFPNQNGIDYDVKHVDTTNKTIDNAFLKVFLKREYNLIAN